MSEEKTVTRKAPAKRELTPKQEAFARHYVETGNALLAAAAAGVTISTVAPKEGAYVYLLLCPEMRRLLYVGKGRGRRMHHHLRDVRSGRVSGTKKHKGLAEYVRRGKQPVAVVFEAGLDDGRALELEKNLIRRFGLKRLLNSGAGPGSPWVKALAEVEEMQMRLLPYDEWIRLRNPPEYARKYHNMMVRELAKLKVEYSANV